jgi:2-polyprenyl-3-methyl-5-hydroxy-6-metoxy-1,4-benzoquinol methylase
VSATPTRGQPGSWDDIADYWRSHNRRRGRYDPADDPDGLNNVCQSGAPLAVNRYYARFQRVVYEELLQQVPHGAGRRALDVGCGTGRWCRLLHEQGFAVTGVDLQDELVAANRERYPDMRFQCGPIQTFTAEDRFDLVSSVTVIQHMPPDEQRAALGNIARLVKPGGHVLLLENVGDHDSPIVFAHPAAEWTAMLREHGFEALTIRRYDYSPVLRLYYALTGPLRRRMGGPTGPAERLHAAVPEDTGMRRVDNACKRAAAWCDGPIESLLVRRNPPLPTMHCGFLFRAPEHRSA